MRHAPGLLATVTALVSQPAREDRVILMSERLDAIRYL